MQDVGEGGDQAVGLFQEEPQGRAELVVAADEEAAGGSVAVHRLAVGQAEAFGDAGRAFEAAEGVFNGRAQGMSANGAFSAMSGGCRAPFSDQPGWNNELHMHW